MQKLIPSRSDYLPSGRSPARLRAQSEKAIQEIEKRIEKLSEPYIDVDNSVIGAASDLAAAFEKFKLQILETQKYLEEAAE